VSVKDLIKLGSLIPSWPWPKVGYLVAVGLLCKGIVTFDQALLLACVAIIIDRGITRRSAASAGPNNRKASL